jgi:hypothetical protein
MKEGVTLLLNKVHQANPAVIPPLKEVGRHC